MLMLDKEYLIINGVSLLPDHADPNQYYYLPLMPKLTERLDPATGQEVPQFEFIQYRGSAGNGGLVNFDVNLGINEAQLDEIRSKLQAQKGLRETPRLAPVPLVDGTVKLMLFGQESDTDPTAPADPDQPHFVRQINHAEKPALYGSNQATFSVHLDESGAAIFQKAIQGEMMPIGIIYSLDFLALRPAYSFTIKADWNRVQEHLDETFALNVLFSSVEVSKVIDKLIEDKVVEIEINTFVPEGEDVASVIGRRDQLIKELKEMLLTTFFEPSLEPVKEEEDGWDKAMNVATQVSNLAVTGGWGGIASFTYKKVDLKRIDQKMLNVNVSERTTVRRTISPQGHINGLTRLLRQNGLSPDGFIMQVDTDHPYFKHRKVELISRANLQSDQIESINVMLRYGSTPKNDILDGSNERATVEWPSIVQGDEMQWDVKYHYRVTFQDVDTTERPKVLESPEWVTLDEKLQVNPLGDGLYHLIDIPVVALNFPWQKYPNVQVMLRYDDDANAIHLRDTVRLSADKPSETWKQFVLDSTQTAFSYKVTYQAADGRVRETNWLSGDRGEITLRDPFPQTRTVMIIPAVNWDEVQMILVDLSYQDAVNHVSKDSLVTFTKDQSAPQTFSVDLENPNQRLINYQITMIMQQNKLLELPRSATFDDRIIITKDMRGHKVVLVEPEAVDFAAKHLKEVAVDLRFSDPTAGLSFTDAAVFHASGEQFIYEYDFANDQNDCYDYRVTYRFINGLSKVTDWQATDVALLRLPVT